MTLRTLNYGNYGIFLIMGHAGFCPSTEGPLEEPLLQNLQLFVGHVADEVFIRLSNQGAAPVPGQAEVLGSLGMIGLGLVGMGFRD